MKTETDPAASEPENPPAFPTEGYKDLTSGMTLRDYFAAKAMEALIVSRPPEVDRMGYIFPTEWRPIVSGAFKLADEMLIERARQKGAR